MKTKIHIVSLAALVAVLVMTGCAGPAVRHDYRVDRRYDRHDNRYDRRYDRYDNRYDRRDARYYY
jgi:hypothetical protein